MHYKASIVRINVNSDLVGVWKDANVTSEFAWRD